MRRNLVRLFLSLLVVSTILAGCRSQQELAFKAVETKTHSAVTPTKRDRHQERHQQFNARVKQGNVDLIFIGDSITHRWESGGKQIWKQYYSQCHDYSS